jgi:hypothetical protein
MAEQTGNSKEIPAVLLFPFVPYSLIPFVISIPGLGPEPRHLLPGLERQEPEDLTQYVADITLLPHLLPGLERQGPAELTRLNAAHCLRPQLLPGLERQEPEDQTQYVADITLLPHLLPGLERQEPAELTQQAGDWSLLCLLVSVCANI